MARAGTGPWGTMGGRKAAFMVS
ncbi:hypothetical protein PPSIR1_10430 [Plesiocystis pacifica SIR-1]|uniref:Uncharacterized protein n=1 Tax=Plesiocystis pacifica SIR-1 TaxID=391625 RepID=A6GI57_9BACT|nr:hypothetical protein PPSIR1_10430 [Plesiocystis pacifica SIR-1]